MRVMFEVVFPSVRTFLLAALAAALPTFATAQPIPIDRFRGCLGIEDMTKERLDCFDAIVPPQPQPVSAKPKTIMDCRFYKEEDERLLCYNSFLVTRIPAAPRASRPRAIVTPPAQNIIVAPPAQNIIVTPPVENIIVTPPVENIIVTPPVQSTIVTPPVQSRMPQLHYVML